MARDTNRKTPDEIYDEFWRELVETDGELDIDKVKAELADFHFVMQQVPKVYMHVTGDRLSKVNYHADAVISAADDFFERQVSELREEWEEEHRD